MRTIPAGLAAHLDGDATNVCHAWRVTRRDGVVLGFTEHDYDLTFDDTVFRAASGFQASDTEATVGLSVDASEIVGGLSTEAIGEADLAAGRYDGARIEVFLVNWRNTGQRLLLRTGELGEVTRAGDAFRAEFRRLTHVLDQVKGRVYSHRCDAVFGDQRCGVDATAPAYRASGAVVGVEDALRIRVSGLATFPSRFFRHGLMTFTGGANDGVSADIEDHRKPGGAAELTLWLPLPAPLVAGDTFTITAGCDKTFATCRLKFLNGLNFKGFPHMPGSDFTYGYADGDTVHDGRPLYE